MQDTLQRLLRREWSGISGGRPHGTIFWCEVDRRDIRTTYERVIQVVAALAGVGGQGKEMWINLTGGYIVGPQWELIQPYEERLQRARQAGPTLEALARQVDWLEREVIPTA